MKERVACYIRVSTQEQKLHGISLDAQRDKLQEYAEKHNLEIANWYEDEGISGRKLIKKRPALQRMLNDAKDKKFDRIIFIKLDRFFRSVAEYHECMKYISPVVWTATEEQYDLTTANGRMFVNMKLTIAELEADQTSERIKIVNDYKIKSGQAVTGSQSLTLGYATERDANGVARVVKDKKYEALVNDVIEYFLVHQSVRLTQKKIAVEKYGTQISGKVIRNMLSDTKLYGYYRGNSEYCEPYVDRETFDKIQTILSKRNIKMPPTGRTYLYTGLIRCPLCGRKLNANTHKSTYTQKTTSIEKTTYSIMYFCSKGWVDRTCACKTQLSEKKIEKYLLDNFENLLKEHIEAKTKEIKKIESAQKDDKKLLENIEKEKKNLTTAFIKGRISEKDYDDAYVELEARITALKSSQTNDTIESVKEYKELIKSDWKALYMQLDMEHKRAFWRKYIDYMVINPNAGKIDELFFF